MDENKIFRDIKVPESVDRKMQDAYAGIKRAKKSGVWKVVKAVSAFAAAAAVFVMTIWGPELKEGMLNNANRNQATMLTPTAGNEDLPVNTGKPFVVRAYAAELREGNPFRIVGFDEMKENGIGWSAGYVCGEKAPTVLYVSMNLFRNITVEGENIDTIEFSLSGATFAVTYIPGESGVKSSVADDKFVHNWYHNGYGEIYDYRNSTKVSCKEDYYSSFKIDYDGQNDRLMEVCIVKPYSDDINCRILGILDDFITNKQANAIFNDVWKDVYLNIKVTYKDGTEYSRTNAFVVDEGGQEESEKVGIRFADNGGIEYNDLVTVDIKKINTATNATEDVGRKSLIVWQYEPEFGMPYFHYDGESFSYNENGKQLFIQRMNDIIGTKVGESFSLERGDGYIYTYTVVKIIPFDEFDSDDLQ